MAPKTSAPGKTFGWQRTARLGCGRLMACSGLADNLIGNYKHRGLDPIPHKGNHENSTPPPHPPAWMRSSLTLNEKWGYSVSKRLPFVATEAVQAVLHVRMQWGCLPSCHKGVDSCWAAIGPSTNVDILGAHVCSNVQAAQVGFIAGSLEHGTARIHGLNPAPSVTRCALSSCWRAYAGSSGPHRARSSRLPASTYWKTSIQ